MNNGLFVLLFLTMTWSATFASLALKQVTNGGGRMTLIGLILNRFLWIGGILYVGSALINIILLRYYPLSLILPLSAFTYVWTMAVSGLVLKQKISKRQVLGILLIITGAICVSI